MNATPRDGFGIPAALGNFNGRAIPVKVKEDGTLCVEAEGLNVGDINVDGLNVSFGKYSLIGTIAIDLSVARTKQRIVDTNFDSLTVTGLKGSFFMYIGGNSDSLRCSVDSRISIGVTAEEVYITNESQPDGSAEIWLFKAI